MKQMSLIKAINYIASIPGNESIRVYWEPPTGYIYIVEEESPAGVPDTASLISAGDPQKFFNLLHQLLTHHVFHRDDD